MMPSSTTEEKQVKIRDMEALGRWYANALSPNEGFAGLLKPDYLSFHHNSFYASAYTPDALHNAALIQYLLSGTSFALGKKHAATRSSRVSTVDKKDILLISNEASRLLVNNIWLLLQVLSSLGYFTLYTLKSQK